YNYDLKAYALNERINVAKPYQQKMPDNAQVTAAPYAYVFKYESVRDVEFLAGLLKKNVKVRSALKAFTTGNQSFDIGSLIITRRNNESIADFDNVVQGLAKEMGRKIYTTNTGFVDKGKDFGSGYVNFIKAPKVAVVFGEQTSSLSSGEIWHFFEQQIHYPITQLGTDYIKTIDLKKYDVLIVPEGNYRLFDDPML